MGVMNGVMGVLLGNGVNVVKDAAEVFRVNAENADARDVELQRAVLEEFAHEFAMPRRNWFDTLVDGMNRLPRPLLALGTVFLAALAMIDPIWFASRMQGIALVPEPLWWLLGAIVGFYFGARHQTKGQEFQRSIAETLARTAQVTEGIAALNALEAGSGLPRTRSDTSFGAQVEEAEVIDIDSPEPNAALAEWKDAHRR
jgi:hypothetical protein